MESDIAYKKISSIQYSLLNPDTIRKISAAKIITPELYGSEGIPVRGGLLDPRMGVIEPGQICPTCGKPAGKCPGHFGHIELARPVIHIEFVPFIKLTLDMVCHNCGRVKLNEEERKFALQKIRKYMKEKRWNRLYKFIRKFVYLRAEKRTKCPHCGYENKEIEFKKPYYFFIKVDQDKLRKMYPTEIRSILEKIPDEDLELIGFHPSYARPEWMILTVLPVPPVTVRPSIILETGERAEDDLTHKLVDIVRTNLRLKEAITYGAPQIVVDQLWDLLQYHIATYINNSVAGLPKAKHRSGKPIKSLVERIVGKYGRIRYNLLGKRTNFNARAVISPDPFIKPNEVGVPIYVAKTLTVPEKVNQYNLERMRKYILNGPNNYPGANYVITPDGKRIQINDENKEALASKIEPGWIVERHLIDGDIALFNRQPSLHRMSLMGHYIKVLPGNTFRLNPVVCLPYNADFDGDEMNLHIPQTEEARAEARLLVALENHMITPRYGDFIVGGKQDIITGIYLLTQDDTKLSFGEAVDLLYKAKATKEDLDKLERFIENAKKEGRNYLTGKEVFSALLPDDVNIKTQITKIENGVVKEGYVEQSLIQEGSGKLFAYLYYKYGKEYTIEFIHKVELLGILYQSYYGITMSISDLDIKDEHKKRIEEIKENTKKKVEEIYNNYLEGKIETLPGRTLKETYQIYAKKTIADSLTEIQKIIREAISKNSGLYIMISSGARGKWDDAGRMIGSLGFQEYRGRFIEFGYNGRNLTIFERNVELPQFRGWVISSYKEGLKPWELFFHSLPGRDSLMDMSIRTQQSGYLYRRLSHALYEIFVNEDGTVRDAYGRIIQYKWGEDGIAVEKSFSGSINLDFIVNEIVKGEDKKEEKGKRKRKK